MINLLKKMISEHCQNQNIDDYSHDVLELFNELNAPKSLRGIVPVLRQIVACIYFRPSEFITIIRLNEEQVRQVVKLLKELEITLNKQNIKSEFNNIKIANKWKSEKPIYALLIASRGASLKSEQLLLSEFIYHYLTHYQDEHIARLTISSRALRLILKKSLVGNLEDWSSKDEFLNAAEKQRLSLDANSVFDTYLRELNLFFRGGKRAYKARKMTEENFKITRLETPYETDLIFDDEVVIKSFCPSSDVEVSGLSIEDCHNEISCVEAVYNEHNSVPIHPMAINNKNFNEQKSVNISAKKSKARNRTLMASSVMQLHQLYIIFSEILLVSKTNTMEINNVPKNVIILTIWLCIYLGKSIQEIMELNIGNIIDKNGIVYEGRKPYFTFSIVPRVQEINENRVTQCKLSIPEYWELFISKFHSCCIETNSKTMFISEKYQENLENAVDNYLSRISKKNNTSITINALSGLLISRYGIKGNLDLTSFDFAFDNESIHTRTPAFYACHDSEYDIGCKINKMWEELEKDIVIFKSDFCFPTGFYTTSGNPLSKPVGSVFCPSSDLKDVCNLVNALKKNIKLKDEFLIKKDLHNLVSYHNNYVLYVSKMLLYTTAYRVINDPLPALGKINRRHQLLTITDKDYLDRISTRTIPLTDIFCSQVEMYINHVKKLIPSLIVYQPNIASDIFPAIETNSLLNIKNLSKHGPLFTLTIKQNGDLISEKISRKFLETRICENQSLLKVNSGRHLLKSFLSKKIDNQELVFWFMGHGNFGESPLETRSSFNIHTAKKLILPTLNQLLGDCQWEAIPSVLN